MTTVTGIAMPTPTIPVTVSILFIIATRFEGPKVTTVTGMATPTPTIPVTVDTFQIARRFEGPKVTTVTGMAMPTPTIPVTVDTFHVARGSRGPKVTTVTGMASTQPPPPQKKEVTKKKKNQKIKLHPIVICEYKATVPNVEQGSIIFWICPCLPHIFSENVGQLATANSSTCCTRGPAHKQFWRFTP